MECTILSCLSRKFIMYNGTSQAPTSRLLDTGKAISLQAAYFPSRSYAKSQ